MNSTIPFRPVVMAPMTNPGRAWVKTTYQLAATIPATVDTLEATFKDACKTVIYWVKDRPPERMPQAAWDGDSFRIELPGMKKEAIAIPELGTWSFRFEHPDMPFGDRPAIPGRTWTTDIALKKNTDSISVAVRGFCSSLPYSGDAEIALTRPRVILDWATRHGIKDVRRLSRDPWLLRNEQDLIAFKSLLSNPNRQLPVVVLTQPDRNQHSVPVSEYLLDARELANRCCGVAHIVQMPWDLAFQWTSMVGKPWSVFLGAVRTYMPKLDWDYDAPSQHPSTFAEKILFWKQSDSEHVGEGPFTEFLCQRLFQYAAFRRADLDHALFISEARTKLAEVARHRAVEGADWMAIYEEQISALDSKIKELEKEMEEYSDDAMRTGTERDQYKDENRRLRFQVDYLRQSLSERSGGKSESEIAIPDNFEEVPEWVSRHLTGRLELHSRAHRGLKNADYEEVNLVYKALLLLANEYRNLCLGREKAQEEFTKGLEECGLRLDRSISKERAGEQGDEYFVRFPTASSPKKFLEWHLRKGSNKESRYCLAVYFFWDKDTEQVVVGWLPSHLDNRMT